MNIRRKLSLQFAAIVSTILVCFSLVIYVSYERSRRNDFYNRLEERAVLTASIITDVVDKHRDLIRRIDTTSSTLYREQVMIFDRNGNLVYNDRAEDRQITGNLAKKIFSSNRILLELPYGYEGIGIEYGNKTYSYAVVVSALDYHGKNRLSNLKLSLFISTILGILFSFLGGWYFARKSLMPMSQVVSRVNLITENNLNERLDEGNGHDEISELSSTFNRMLERLELAFTLQKSFVSHASHEFRTPLTIMLSEIEMMMINHSNNEELQQMLRSVKEEILSLNNLSTKLLSLAKTNLDFSNSTTSGIRIDELIMSAISDFSKANPTCKINLEFSDLPENQEFLVVEGEEQLLKTAFINLISNAFKFSNDSAVFITVGFSNARTIFISFKDNGVGIPPEEVDNIFEPFYRISTSNKVEGHGLGLALTSRIISLHKGTIRVRSKVGQGSEFTVMLPTATRR